MASQIKRIAVVAIGRNEGERLERCLLSLKGLRVVYVDSGSTDGSVKFARSAGVDVVELSSSLPFTAARARNAGLANLGRDIPPPDYVQFIDGDCELQPEWLEIASSFLETHPTVAAVCGRRREIHPTSSIYNRLCDREWNTKVGNAKSCGGDTLMRFDAISQVGGYNPSLIAGEEPELCVRLRANGWKIWRLDAAMTFHDAEMSRFGQWWKRTSRAGYASAQGVELHGGPPEYLGVVATLRAILWGLVLPLLIAFLGILWTPVFCILLLVYPLQATRIAWREGLTRSSWEYAIFLVLGKFAEATGIVGYLIRRGRGLRIVEYK